MHYSIQYNYILSTTLYNTTTYYALLYAQRRRERAQHGRFAGGAGASWEQEPRLGGAGGSWGADMGEGETVVEEEGQGDVLACWEEVFQRSADDMADGSVRCTAYVRRYEEVRCRKPATALPAKVCWWGVRVGCGVWVWV